LDRWCTKISDTAEEFGKLNTSMKSAQLADSNIRMSEANAFYQSAPETPPKVTTRPPNTGGGGGGGEGGGGGGGGDGGGKHTIKLLCFNKACNNPVSYFCFGRYEFNKKKYGADKTTRPVCPACWKSMILGHGQKNLVMKDGTKIDYKEEVHGKAYKELMTNPNMGKEKLGTQALAAEAMKAAAVDSAAGNDLEAQVAVTRGRRRRRGSG
jgi:hypothetical protein